MRSNSDSSTKVSKTSKTKFPDEKKGNGFVKAVVGSTITTSGTIDTTSFASEIAELRKKLESASQRIATLESSVDALESTVRTLDKAKKGGTE